MEDRNKNDRQSQRQKKGKELYGKLVNSLRDNEPSIEDPGAMADSVIAEITSDTKQTNSNKQTSTPGLLFAWTSVPWLRHSLSAAAAVFLGLMLLQQTMLNRRIASLEEQVIYYLNPTESTQPASPGVKEKLLVKYITREDSDSITISRADMEEFMEQHQENIPLPAGTAGREGSIEL